MINDAPTYAGTLSRFFDIHRAKSWIDDIPYLDVQQESTQTPEIVSERVVRMHHLVRLGSQASTAVPSYSLVVLV